ncbi:MAG: hypothetical protein PHQ65_10370 [Bacteroidales bacterium]|jgi:hypothetical protein|nr:hypothetical protein [Bacteroidales bacterium]MDD3665656.1 hypothetical protein [Bacteroidales bacterium]
MMQEEFYGKITSVVNTHFPKMLMVEKGSWLLQLAGLTMYSLDVAGGDVLATVGGLLLSTNYYLWSYKTVDTSKLQNTSMLSSTGLINFIYKLNYLSLALGCTIPVFTMMGAQNPLFYTAGLSLFLALLLALASKLSNRDVPFSGAFFLRGSVVMMFIAYLAVRNL